MKFSEHTLAIIWMSDSSSGKQQRNRRNVKHFFKRDFLISIGLFFLIVATLPD